MLVMHAIVYAVQTLIFESAATWRNLSILDVTVAQHVSISCYWCCNHHHHHQPKYL